MSSTMRLLASLVILCLVAVYSPGSPTRTPRWVALHSGCEAGESGLPSLFRISDSGAKLDIADLGPDPGNPEDATWSGEGCIQMAALYYGA